MTRYWLVTPKRAGGDLLDGAVLRVAVGQRLVALRVLAAFAGVALAADAVHRDRQGLVGLLADGAVAHRPGLEPLDDGLDRLHLVDGDGLRAVLNSNKPRSVQDSATGR